MNDPLRTLYATVCDRRTNPQEGSYTCYLFDKGMDKILKKVGEECAETIIAAKNGVAAETVGEVSDLLYHLMVMLARGGYPRRRRAAPELERAQPEDRQPQADEDRRP